MSTHSSRPTHDHLADAAAAQPVPAAPPEHPRQALPQHVIDGQTNFLGVRVRTYPHPTSPESEQQRLHNVVQQERVLASDIMKVYGTERALARIAQDDTLAHGCVLKGGFLLRTLLPSGVRRSTTDADFYVRDMSKDQVVDRLTKVLSATHSDDRVVFDPRTLQATPMQEEQGLRLTFKGSLGKSAIDGMLDVGFSAALVPGAQRVDIPPMLRHAQMISVSAYAPETVIAEKHETIFRRGTTNTRLKDYYDLAVIGQHVPISGQSLVDGLSATCALRGTKITDGRPQALQAVFADDPDNLAAWSRLKSKAPLVASMSLQQAADRIWQFLEAPTEAARQGTAFAKVWDPKAQQWR